MTTATEAARGTRACYLRGCDHSECSNAHNRYMKRYRFDRDRGTARRVDSTPVREHVRELVAEGWSHRQIATAAECDRRIITAAANNEYPTMAADLAQRILAARPSIASAPPSSYVDATGSIRRVRALIAAGHSLVDLATAISIGTTPLGRIVNHGQPTITARVAASITAVYDKRAEIPGTNERARRRGARLGWKTPDFWEDWGGIDDPDFQPPNEDIPRYARIGEDALWLRNQDLTDEQIADRFGITKNYLQQSIRRYRDALEAAA